MADCSVFFDPEAQLMYGISVLRIRAEQAAYMYSVWQVLTDAVAMQAAKASVASSASFLRSVSIR